MAEYENEVRSERIRAGQAATRARGVTWGGSTEGRYVKVTRDQERMIVKLVGKGEKIAVIGSTTLAFICTFGVTLLADQYFPGGPMKHLLLGAMAFGALSSATFATAFLCRPSGSSRERETCCRKCGYVLRGISEPRCPECGERI